MELSPEIELLSATFLFNNTKIVFLWCGKQTPVTQSSYSSSLMLIFSQFASYIWLLIKYNHSLPNFTLDIH